MGNKARVVLFDLTEHRMALLAWIFCLSLWLFLWEQGTCGPQEVQLGALSSQGAGVGRRHRC